MFEEKTKNAVQALAELGEVLLTGETGIFTRTGHAITPLGAEAEKLHAEAKSLSDAAEKLRPIVAAKSRVLLREADDALVAGDEAGAASLRQDAKNLESELQTTMNNAQSCQARALELEREIKATGAKVYSELYPLIRTSTVQICRAVVNLFDTLDAGLRKHADENGYPVNYMHLVNLTPYEHGVERGIFLGLLRWFGGRQQ